MRFRECAVYGAVLQISITKKVIKILLSLNDCKLCEQTPLFYFINPLRLLEALIELRIGCHITKYLCIDGI